MSAIKKILSPYICIHAYIYIYIYIRLQVIVMGKCTKIVSLWFTATSNSAHVNVMNWYLPPLLLVDLLHWGIISPIEYRDSTDPLSLSILIYFAPLKIPCDYCNAWSGVGWYNWIMLLNYSHLVEQGLLITTVLFTDGRILSASWWIVKMMVGKLWIVNYYKVWF